MGLIRGNPIFLVALFFGAAVVLMGGIYTLVPSALSAPDPLTIGIIAALSVSLGFSMLVIGRIFWVVAKATYPSKSAKLGK